MEIKDFIKDFSISQKPIGRNLLVYPMLRKLRIKETVDRVVGTNAKIPMGTIVELMILSRFSEQRVPMYRLEQFYFDSQLKELYGYDAEKINDDRTGRCLDAIDNHLSEMKTEIVLRAIKEFRLSVNQIHSDMTNILFCGSYETETDEANELDVTYGHTKKGQDPRCKQVNLSLSVTADGGVPLHYQVANGNTNDSNGYLPHLQALQEALGISHPLIVGDGKLGSRKNLIAFCRANAFFITPDSLDKNEKNRLKRLWQEGIAFSPLSVSATDNGPSLFKAMEREAELFDKQKKKRYPLRYIYIFSKRRREVTRHTKAKSFVKAKAALHKIRRCLNKYDYKTRRVIESRIENQVIKKCPYYQVKLHHDKERGFSIDYSIDRQTLREDEIFDGIYLLKTNLLAEKFSINDVFAAYKGQPNVERCFQTAKQPPIEVSPVWLHNPKRIKSLLFCVFLALMIVTLLQREARAKVGRLGLALRPEGRDHLPITPDVLLRAFDSIGLCWLTVEIQGNSFRTRQLTNVENVHQKVFSAFGFSEISSYLRPAGLR